MRNALVLAVAAAGCSADSGAMSTSMTDGGSSSGTSMGVTATTTSDTETTSSSTATSQSTTMSTSQGSTSEGGTGTDGDTEGDPLGPWDDPVAVAELNIDVDVDDDDPWLSPDMLEIYFTSNRGALGDTNVWVATRNDADAPWDAPVQLGVISTTQNEGNPVLGPGGLSLYFSRTVNDDTDIYVTVRNDTGASFGNPTAIDELNTTGMFANDLAAVPTDDHLTLFFARATGAGVDLMQASRDTTDEAWTGTAEVMALNSASDDTTPWIDADASWIAFASDRSGNSDLYIASRPDPQGMWSSPEAIAELNTANVEGDPWLSADRRTIYFSRQDMGQSDIYVSTR